MVVTLKATIVAIDDDPLILTTVLSVLKDLYVLKPFTSGKAALKYLGMHSADLILTDCNMPEMSGFEVLKSLRQNTGTSSLPVIFLTGSNDEDSEIHALEGGASDYIAKPINPNVLKKRVSMQLELHAYRNRMEHLVDEKTRNLTDALDKLKTRENATLNLLAKVTDMRDEGTGDHIWRTTEFVRLLTKEILANPTEGYLLSETEAADIIESSKLHDIGKIGVPDQILRKTEKLTDEEFDVIRGHPEKGVALLDEFGDIAGDDTFLNTARDITLSHHEKWNGKGYPHGLKEREIPLSARIAAIADVYDALISVRPYKKSFSHEEAMRIIIADSGQHFDPHLVTLFVKHGDRIRNIAGATFSKSRTTVIRKNESALHQEH